MGPAVQKTPLVSVIIPTFNSDPVLGLCLEALAKQTYPARRTEILVIDNGSTVIDAAMRARFPKVRWLKEAQPGSYAARNRGLKEAKGDIVAFTDADTIPDPRWIERGVAVFQAHPEAGAVAGRVQVFPADPAHPNAAEVYDMAFGFPQHLHVSVSKFGVTANLFTTRQVLEKIGPFDTKLLSMGDRDWGNRVHAAGLPILYADDASVLHPARASGAELRRKTRRTAGGTHDVLQKEWSRLSRGKRAWARTKHWTRLLVMAPAAPPVRVLKAVRRGDVRPAWRAFPLLLLFWSIMYARLFESIRLAFGGKPLR